MQPQVEHHLEDNVLIRSAFHFREYKPKSEIIKLDYCYCCGTFECKCTEEELTTFKKFNLIKDKAKKAPQEEKTETEFTFEIPVI